MHLRMISFPSCCPQIVVVKLYEVNKTVEAIFLTTQNLANNVFNLLSLGLPSTRKMRQSRLTLKNARCSILFFALGRKPLPIRSHPDTSLRGVTTVFDMDVKI